MRWLWEGLRRLEGFAADRVLRGRGQRRACPRLEWLEERLVPYTYSFIGFRFSDATWELARNWQSNDGGTSWPQNSTDTAIFATTSMGITIPADVQQLGTLDLEKSYGGTMTCAAQLDLTQLIMHGGTLLPFQYTVWSPFNGDLLLDGNSTWDGGTLGSSSSGDVEVRNGATLTVTDRPDNSTVSLATNLYVGARNNNVTTLSGNVNLQSVIVDLNGTNSRFIVQNWGTSWGTLDFGIDTTLNPPVGDTITNGGTHAQISDYGVVNVDGNPGNTTQLVTHASSIPVGVNAAGILNVRKMNKITFSANLSNHNWAVEATDYGIIAMGGLRPGETGAMGSAQLATANDGTYGVHIANTGNTGSGASFNVYGEHNVLTLAGATSQLSVDGQFTLCLLPSGRWQLSTLEVATGFVNFGPASQFTFYADPVKGGPNCISDNLTVDAGDVNFNASGSRPTVSAQWYNGGDNISGLTATLDFLNTKGGGQIKQNVGLLILTGNNPPGATGLWSLSTVGTPVTELDAVWTSN